MDPTSESWESSSPSSSSSLGATASFTIVSWVYFAGCSSTFGLKNRVWNRDWRGTSLLTYIADSFLFSCVFYSLEESFFLLNKAPKKSIKLFLGSSVTTTGVSGFFYEADRYFSSCSPSILGLFSTPSFSLSMILQSSKFSEALVFWFVQSLSTFELSACDGGTGNFWMLMTPSRSFLFSYSSGMSSEPIRPISSWWLKESLSLLWIGLLCSLFWSAWCNALLPPDVSGKF